MTTCTLRRAALAGLLALAACGQSSAPWLTMPSVASHSEFFQIEDTSHAAMDCNQCHTAAGFLPVTCTTGGCHPQAATDALHLGNADYAYASPKCIECHRVGSISTAEHVAHFFPIGTGTQHAIPCGQCHADLANRDDPATLLCRTCHVRLAPDLRTRHVGTSPPVSDYIDTSPGCLRCHAFSQVDRVASHPRGEDTIYGGEGEHRTVGCLRCHSGLLADRPWAANWDTTPGCRSCH